MESNKFMSNDSGWDYSNMVQAAKQYGGPHKFLKNIYEEGCKDTRKEDIVIGGIAVSAFLGLCACKKCFDRRKQFKKNKLCDKYEVAE